MRRLVTWLSIAVMLMVFSGTLLESAFARGKTLDQAVTAVMRKRTRNGALVELETGGRFALFRDFFGLEARTRICWVSRSALRRLEARYRTTVSTVRLGSRGSFPLVTVKGAKPASLRSILRQSTCELVRVHRVFFLPFDPHTS